MKFICKEKDIDEFLKMLAKETSTALKVYNEFNIEIRQCNGVVSADGLSGEMVNYIYGEIKEAK